MKSQNGWVKIHRSILDWEWYSKPDTFRVFMHLIVRANHADARWQGHPIKRGQLITSTAKLSTELSISQQSIKTALRRLKKTGEITSESTSSFTTITLCKYDTYQSEQLPINQQNNQQLTSDQLAANQQPTINKKEKKENNDEQKEEETMSSKRDAVAILKYLNQKTGKSFRAVDTHVKLIQSRLSEAEVTLEGAKAMIDAKCRDWLKDHKMRDYLRPQTLFSKSKFADYYDQRNNQPANRGTTDEDYARGF